MELPGGPDRAAHLIARQSELWTARGGTGPLPRRGTVTETRSMGTTLLRAATVADVELILELIRALAVFEGLADQVEVTRERLERTLFGPSPAAEVLLALEGDLPVGFAVHFPTFSTFLGKPGLHLEDVYVRPEHRGRGHGRAMLRHLAALAVQRGCGRLEWTVLDWNETALGFYRRLGADVLPDWRRCRLAGGALDRLAAGS